MKTKRLIVGIAVLVAVVAGSLTAIAQLASYRVLIVDGTKTLTATMRVVGLAGGIRQSGVADVTIMLADDLGPFDDPLQGAPRPEAAYDLILIIPRGIDDGTATRIWVLVPGNPDAEPLTAQAVALLGAGIDRAFAGLATAVGPLDDLWAALTASFYVVQGWLR